MDQLTRVQPINKLIRLQFVALVITVLFFFVWQGVSEALASMFGSAMGLVNTFLQKWHLIQAAKLAKSDASMNLRKAYRCVLERWVLTIVLFTVGFAVLNLSALPLLSGFVLTQIAMLFGNMNRA